ncbi:TonB-linked outer membrane protein, SusC/RagA family [Catalinimonas alkaloidigena]|uniref:TonB-linked outer membrane protein, SusC/RagA family n=1 Tax=Catalinimonas alkaloidigena TaxID=1075417 RepID=A0A1G9AIF6_9BACT|nr:TonB-dependent receptor [Catalinimonas alkaloidigena]SDK27051.1 TonB-linked outer membrane protein, SusC/RagA family [Catalinimonas alkaloidigena]
MRKTLLLILTLFASACVMAQGRQISGVVRSGTDNGVLPGVNVSVKGSTVGTITDVSGAYTLEVPADAKVLVYSFIGFVTQEVAINNRSTLDVTLEEDIAQLNEVVVIGYGTQERRDLTGSVASVRGEAIENLVTPSFESQLAGRAPGVQITTPGGVLGQAPLIRIRGVNSLTSGADPLIVIDGVPVVTDDRSGIVPANPLANINPADIASFEVLKDGSATAIYGSRAANGVLLITTKRGTAGKTQISYNVSAGFNEEVSRFDLLTGDEFVTIANEKRTNAGATALAQPGENTDWQDYIFRKGGVQQHSLSFRGGSEATQFFFSLGFTDQNSALIANDLQRYSFRANVDHTIKERLKLGTSLSYAFTTINGLNNGANSLSGAVYNATRMLPNVSILDPTNTAFDGFNVQPDGSTLGIGNNLATVDNNIPNIAFVLANNVYRNRNHRLLGSVYGELEIVKGLRARTQVGTDVTLSDDFLSWDPRHGDGRGRNGYASQEFNPAYRWNWQNTLNYQTTLGEAHHLDVTVGAEYQLTNTYNFGAVGQGFSDRFYQQRNLISGSYGTQTISGGFSQTGFDSYFGRLNYNFKGRYLLSVALRNDGISSLPLANRRGTFPGGSIGWRISEEEFFNSTLVRDLKLRASYAEVGNVEIGAFPYVGGFGAVLYGPNPGIAFNQVANSDLQWESSKKYNIGLDLTIERFTLTADVFRNNIDNLVLDAPVAPSLGVPSNSITQNVGAMYNQGLELRLQANVLEKGTFSWTTDFNFTTIRNEVTRLVNPLTSTYNRTEEGSSIAQLYGYQWAGVNSSNGNPMYEKADGSVVQYNLQQGNLGWRVYDPANPADISQTSTGPGGADLTFLGNTLPKWQGGWSNQFRLGSFDLEVFLRYSGGNYIMNESLRGLLGQGFANNHASILGRWTESGDEADVPKLYSGQDANMWQTGAANSRFVEKGDFLRVQNIVLGYRVPSDVLSSLFGTTITSVRAFAQVQNLLTFSKYSGLDPELNQYSSQLQYGVDWNVAPIIRTWSAGINIGF